MKSIILLFVMIVASAIGASAQDIEMNDAVSWQCQTYACSGSVTLNYSVIFNPITGIVPGTVKFSESDPWGLGPFIGAGCFGTCNFVGPGNTAIQIGNEFGNDNVPPYEGSPYPFPSSGPTLGPINWGPMDTVIICNPFGVPSHSPCANAASALDGGGTYIVATSGNLSFTFVPPPAETPEPPMTVLLASGALLFGVIELIRRFISSR
jgi:hypothetical protein